MDGSKKVNKKDWFGLFVGTQSREGAKGFIIKEIRIMWFFKCAKMQRRKGFLLMKKGLFARPFLYYFSTSSS
ncbi:hypothetical protein HYN43_001875 [Mucilaginibacter celer]|uniref:Uncharacterized protein n=1 Tax=Mucilaginibacter celer TaxID=2305508 RepID=A0A494VJS6_9SPHI|nr:hypothetical protein HYN43_001875 [Mucilaginibacter celer]